MKKILVLFCACVFVAGSSFAFNIGGYTTQSMLPSNFKSIFVETFINNIKVTAEQSNMRMYRGYRPGMELELTKAVIDYYLYDGNLKIAREDNADLLLKGTLVDFKRDALRYDTNDNIEEYRIKLIVNLTLIDAKTGNKVWEERGFAGETTYYTTGPMAKGEAQAVTDAIVDLSRRIVERTVEAW